MNQHSPVQNVEVEEITFAELTRLVRAELQSNSNSACEAIANKYGISETTMRKLIRQITAGLSNS